MSQGKRLAGMEDSLNPGRYPGNKIIMAGGEKKQAGQKVLFFGD
jgi:hypothetical protein